VSRTQIFKAFCIFAICFSVVNWILGSLDAKIYKPAWEDTIARCVVLIMVFSVWKEGRWISILMIVEMVIGPLLFYGFGIVKSTTLSFTLAMCWLLTAVFYFKLDQNEKRLGHGRG
jgi:hypothetical protein